MDADVKAVMAQASELDTELNGSSTVCGMVVVDNRGLCIAAEVPVKTSLVNVPNCVLFRVKETLLVPVSFLPLLHRLENWKMENAL